MWIALLIILLLLAAYVFMLMPRLPRRSIAHLKAKYFAHRGLWDENMPENSLSAFQAAVDAGYGIELDVHLTKDGHLVVHHDDSTKRLCGVDYVISQTDLQTLRTCQLHDSGETIPTFDEVLEVVDGKVPLMVEVKVEKNVDAVCSTLWERLKAYDGPLCMESFDPRAVSWFRKNAPQVIRGQLAFNHTRVQRGATPAKRRLNLFIASMFQNVIARPDFISYEAATESPHSVPMNIIRLFRPHMACWTIRSKEELEAAKNRYDLFIFEGFRPL